jgi:mRNA-degrading endonuclease RelE of RelBE toxin-antitoxin system
MTWDVSGKELWIQIFHRATILVEKPCIGYGNAVVYLTMIFIETSVFTKLLPDYLSDDDYRSMQWYLFEHPEAGTIIPGSGGIRKIRWSQEGKGKRGGVRVIYSWKKSAYEIWLITIYAKNEKATIPGHMLKKISEEIKNE